jgi:hypothetical protein
MACSYWNFDFLYFNLIFFMDRYIIKVLLYAWHVKFEQVLGFLPSLGKKSKILSHEKK